MFFLNHFSDMDFTCAFSSLASSLLNSIADFLESGIDDFSTSLYNLTINDDSVDRSDPGEKDTNNNNDSDTNDEVQDQQKMVIQDIRSEVQAIYIYDICLMMVNLIAFYISL